MFLALAALAAFGWARLKRAIQARHADRDDDRGGGAAARIRHDADGLADVPRGRRRSIDGWRRSRDRWSLELPFVDGRSARHRPDGLYMFSSTWHWQPIVNGYSGFFPQSFIELTEHMKSFPDDRSIAYLKTARRGSDRHSRRLDGARSSSGR